MGQIITGTVVQIKEYGAFIELEPGLDGLVHISEINHKRVNNISDELSIGQSVSAKILEIDKERKRISLSIKDTLDLPGREDTYEMEAPVPETDVEREESVEVTKVPEAETTESTEVPDEKQTPSEEE